MLALGPAPALAAKKNDTKRAVELSREAIEKYRAKQFEEAGDLFMRSYGLSARPAQLRNAAKAYEEAGEYDRARELWENYRALDSVTRDEKAEAEAHLALIREKVRNEEISRSARDAARAAELARQDADAARRAAEAVRAPQLEAGVSGPQVMPNYPAWALVAGGTLMIITSIALWFVAQDQLSGLDDRIGMLNGDGLIIGTSPDDVASDVDRINGQRIASGVLLPIGLSAAIGGGLWLIFGS